MAETLESIKQEIANIAAEKEDLKGIVDQQKGTIKRQETIIGNLQEALKAADANMVDQVNKLQKEIDDLKEQVALLESIDAEDHHEDVIELREQVAKLEAIRDTYAKEIDVLNGEIEELKVNGSSGMIAALAAKDEELRKLGEKVPAKDREINDLKEQVKSLEKALDLKGDYYYRAQTEKEHLANAIENAYRSLMIIRGYQLPDESGVSNG